MWETLIDKDCTADVTIRTQRMLVPGGWLVRTVYACARGGSVHQVFLPDPTWSWDPDWSSGIEDRNWVKAK